MDMQKKNRIFLGVWIAAGLMLLCVQIFVRDHSSFIGIAGSRAQEISTSFAAKIKRVHVIAGQSVRKGDLLIEMENPELEVEIHKIKTELDYLLDQKGMLAKVVPVGHVEDSRIINMRNQLDVLEAQKKDLLVFSQYDGKVEAILRREGENSQPLLPILTLQEITPATVHGFIHESIIGEVQIGTEVDVTSMTPGSGNEQGTRQVRGKVISFGSSIVPFPERLLRDISRPMWGREVVIEVDKENGLILGEKVFVAKASKMKNFFSEAYADDKVKRGPQGEFLKAQKEIPIPLSLNQEFEASGLVWLSNIQRFIVVSDGNNSRANPQVALVTKDGKVEKVYIDGLESVGDMESVVLDEAGSLYFVSSIGKDKKKYKGATSRKNMVKITQDGMSFSKNTVIPLGDALELALARQTSPALRELVKGGKLKVDVEGAVIDGDTMLLGLRRVGDSGHAFVLGLKGIKELIKGGSSALAVTLAYELPLKHSDGEVLGISDLARCGSMLYVAAAPAEKKGHKGAIYRLDESSGAQSLVKIHEFAKEKPEGVDCRSSEGTLAVSFDHGKSGSHMVIYALQR